MDGTTLREINLETDIDGLMDIEELCFQYPWTEKDWKRCATCNNTINLVVANKNLILGMLSYEILKDGVEILNIAIHPRFWRQGIGTKLIEQLKNKIGKDRFHKHITLYVRERNLDAQLFFRSLGFRAIEIVKEHYETTQEDAYKFCFPVFVTHQAADSQKAEVW